MKVREVCEGDILSICDLEKRTFTEPIGEKTLKTLLGTGTYSALVAEEGDFLGYVTYERTPFEINICNLAVKEEARRRGVATAILLRLIEISKEENLEAVYLEVRVSNALAVALYEKMEFQKVGLRKGFYSAPKPEDAYTMALKLKEN